MSSERYLEREAAEKQDGVGVFLSNNHIVCVFFNSFQQHDGSVELRDHAEQNKTTVSLTALVR